MRMKKQKEIIQKGTHTLCLTSPRQTATYFPNQIRENISFSHMAIMLHPQYKHFKNEKGRRKKKKKKKKNENGRI